MAGTVTNVDSAGGVGAFTSIVATVASASVGDVLVVFVGADNADTSGALSLSATLTESTGNTCVNRGGLINASPGSVTGDGCTLGLWTIEVTTPITAGLITASFSPSTAGRTITVQKFSPGAGEAISFVEVGAGAIGAASQASITCASVASGDTIFGGFVTEQTSATGTPDSDTTDGSWSTQYAVAANYGGGTNSIALHTQYKTVTGSGAQTYNAGTTATNRDWAINYLVLRSAATGGSAPHPSSGALTGQGSTVAGTAAHKTLHTTTGALTGQASAIAGATNRTHAHPASGALVGQGATVAGSGVRTHLHPASGVLAGQGSALSGTSLRTHLHPTTGALVGAGAQISGASDHVTPGGAHETSGTLTGPGSTISGAATHLTLHSTTGALAGAGSVIAGNALAQLAHTAVGQLIGQSSIIIGTAIRTRLHTTTGVLTGAGSSVVGAANLGAITESTSRIYTIAAEDRALVIAAEDRTYTVTADAD